MRATFRILGCGLGVLLAGACDSPGSPSGYRTSPSAATATNAAVTAAGSAGLATATGPAGTILTDARGHALYLFDADTGPVSTCTGGCAAEWPPLTTTGAPLAGRGVDAALVATSPRPDGTRQVTYNGHPLYLYDDDHDPGTTKGQGENSFGAKWYLLTPAGRAIDDD